MKTQLRIQKALHNRYGGMCELRLGPFNPSLAMLPLPLYPQHGTAPSDALFPGNRPSPPPLVTPVSAPPSCPMASAPVRIYSLFAPPPPAGRGLRSAKMSNVKGALARARDPARTLTLPDGLKWLERSQVEKKKEKNPHSQERRKG